MKPSPTSTSPVASAASQSQPNQSATKPSPSTKPTRPRRSSSSIGGRKSGTTATCAGLTARQSQCLDVLISLRLVCLANLRVMSDSVWARLIHDGYGRQQLEPCGYYDHETRSLKIHQLYLPLNGGSPSTELCQHWSRSGMISGGKLYLQQPLVQGICGNDSSSSLPTPTTNDGQKRGSAYWKEQREQTTFDDNLPRAVAKFLPTATTTRRSMTPQEFRIRTTRDTVDPAPTMPGRCYREDVGVATGAGLQGHAEQRRIQPGPSVPRRPIAPPDLRGRVNRADWWSEAVTGVPVLVNGLPNKLVEAISRCAGNAIVPQSVVPVLAALHERRINGLLHR